MGLKAFSVLLVSIIFEKKMNETCALKTTVGTMSKYLICIFYQELDVLGFMSFFTALCIFTRWGNYRMSGVLIV